MIPSLEKLKTNAWRTSGARYNAARRLRRREFFATVSLALMSALTVAIAFIQRVYAAPSSSADNYLSTVSASLGVFLLTISLVEWGAKAGSKADSLHLNAEKLNTFWRKIAFRIDSAKGGIQLIWPDVQVLDEEYSVIKADCRNNHEPVDDAYFRTHHKLEFPGIGRWTQLKIWISWQFSSIWYIAGIWSILILLALPLRSPDLWKRPLNQDSLSQINTTKSETN